MKRGPGHVTVHRYRDTEGKGGTLKILTELAIFKRFCLERPGKGFMNQLKILVAIFMPYYVLLHIQKYSLLFKLPLDIGVVPTTELCILFR